MIIRHITFHFNFFLHRHVYCTCKLEIFITFKTTVGSKFLMLQESVRDAADIYLSLKYPPTLFVNDTPCTFSRHLDIRAPNVTKYLWGDNVGCFEPPSLDKCPSQVLSFAE